VNVAWNIAWKDNDGMSDDEYLIAWQHVLLPIALEFQPQLVLVSAGFDAARGDVGGCSVTAGGFAQMTRMLQNICSRLVLVLEGGYKLDVISECVCACVGALLGDQIQLRNSARPKKEARLAIERTLRVHRQFWSSLRSPASVDILSEQVIVGGYDACHRGNCDNSDPELQNGSSALQVHETESCATHDPMHSACHHKKQHRKPKPVKPKPVTGVSIATRNAAINNWKADLKKLLRKQTELSGMMAKIDALKQVACCKVSSKDRAVLEQEDDIKWQMEEIATELQQLNSLSKDDVLRMYSGCR
jgi:hypothetical protein